MEPYQYEPFGISKDQVRLINMQPGLEGPVVVEFLVLPLQEAPPYDALAYPQDSRKEKERLECNGRYLLISSELHEFLQAYRQSLRAPSLIWVQEICVNVDDAEEFDAYRGSSSPMYGMATRTLCWIGLQHIQDLKEFIATTYEIGDNVAISNCLSATDIYHSTYKISSTDLQRFETAAKAIDHRILHKAQKCLSLPFLTEGPRRSPHIAECRNLVIFDGQGGISWDHLAHALLAWLLFNPATTLKHESIPLILLMATKRRQLFLVPTMLPTSYNDQRSESEHLHAEMLNVTRMRTLESLHRSESAGSPGHPLEPVSDTSRSTRPLYCSLGDLDNGDYMSWHYRWDLFPLDADGMSFSAYGSLSSPGVSPISGAIKLAENPPNPFTGLLVDVIGHTAGHLPARSHSEHYKIEHMTRYFLLLWVEHAKAHSPETMTHDELLLAFADTIQARGCGHVWEHMSKPVQDRLEEVRNFMYYLGNFEAEETNSIRLFYAACYPSHDRKFALTKGGRFCLVPDSADPGDLVCILRDSRVPYIFRHANFGTHHVIGEAFVQGLMHGEILEDEFREEKEFKLYKWWEMEF